MKRVVFPRLSIAQPDDLEAVGKTLSAGAPTLSVDTVNWIAPSQVPEVKLYAGYDGGHLFLHFSVREASVLALAGCDHGTVWRDSCVELFIAPPGGDLYYNLEMNCIGKALLGCGSSRATSMRQPLSALARVKRKSSLGDTPFDARSGGVSWSLTAVVSLGAFCRHQLGDPKGQTWRANVYKCGDELPEPHFLSWNPVDFVEPDFHRPEHFGEIRFA